MATNQNQSRPGAGIGPKSTSGEGAAAVATASAQPLDHAPLLTLDDLWLFNEGRHHRLWERFGAHPAVLDDVEGTQFAVWAPNAEHVGVIGDFNEWRTPGEGLHPCGSSGVWAGFVPGVGKGARYKYHIVSRHAGYRVDKADPVGLLHETPPQTASVVWDLEYTWGDGDWMERRRAFNPFQSPMSIYEVHLGSWMRGPAENPTPLTYRDLAPRLADYAKRMGYTHVEFMPVLEHPFYGSWGYQATGYFAPTSRFGTPQDFMHLVDTLHQAGVGVILDWAPAHFPSDEHGLAYFDGTHLFEHDDPNRRVHPDWGSYCFNLGRHEVVAFLISSAMHWLETYHIDGLRVDAVASMLYLDYSREAGQWSPNKYGGREDIESIDFLRLFNETVHTQSPGAVTIAEESTAWPMVSRPPYVGGLGFTMKWDMGWMHDTLKYMAEEPVHRRYHHDQLTFRAVYAFNENFVLPLSHDEVVHGKGSLLGKMPGDEWQKFANLRLLLSYMYAQPGKKLLFMGGDFGQWSEWAHDHSIDWHLLEHAPHAGVQRVVRRLNELHRDEPALHRLDCEGAGFEWIDASDALQSVLCFMRRSGNPDEDIAVACNFTPVPRHNYRIGVPQGGFWREIFNSDAREYGGSGQGNLGGLEAVPAPWHGRRHSISASLPPLGVVFFRPGEPG